MSSRRPGMAPWPTRGRRPRGRCWATFRAGWLESRCMRLASASAALALASAVIVPGVGGGRIQSERWLLSTFAEHEVAVEIALERDRSGKAWLVGTYTPSRANFHLYGKDLPRAGIHGVARPTLLELVSSASIRPVRPPAADRATIDLHVAALGSTF